MKSIEVAFEKWWKQLPPKTPGFDFLARTAFQEGWLRGKAWERKRKRKSRTQLRGVQ